MKIQTIGEVVMEGEQTPLWLFEGFLRDKTLTVLGADRHSGKTLLMLDMMICLELGRPLFGVFPTSRSRRTLFIGQDAPEWDYKGVIRKLMKGHGVVPEVGAMFDSMVCLNQGIDLGDPRVWDPVGYQSQLLDLWNEHQFDVLFLDTELEVHRFEENSARQMQEWGKIKKGLRDRLGVSIIASHHLAHQTEVGIPKRLRGSTVIGGTVDYEIIMGPQGGLRDNPRNVSLRCDKARGGVAAWPEFFQIHQGEGVIKLTAPRQMEGWLK